MKPSSILKTNSMKLNAVRISIIYLALSSLWIFLSDKLLELFISDFHTLSVIQSIKGFLFVVLTTILIYFLIKKNTALLFLQNNLLEDILDTSPVGIILTNSTGQITFANNEAEKVLGLQKSYITSRNYNDPQWKITDVDGKVFHEENLPFIKVKNTLKSVKDIQHAIEYPDGRRTILSINASPRFKKNNFDGIVASIQDITEKTISEKSILEKNKFISAITDTIPAIIYIYDFNLQCNIYTNNGIERLLGYTPEEIKQMGSNLFSILIHPDDLKEFNESHSKILTASDESVLSFEYRFKHKNGNWINFQVIERTFLRGDDGSVKQKIGIAVDITQRKHAEEEWRKSEELLRLSIELANVAVWEYDFTTNRMSRSKNHDKLYGLDWQEKWEFETFLNATHPDDREFSNEIIQKSVSPGGPNNYKFDFRVITPSNTIRWLEVTGQVVERDEKGQGIIVRGTLIDITDRKLIENSLRESEEKFHNAFHSSPVGITINKISDGKFLEVNDSFLKMFEYERDEVINRTSIELKMFTEESRKKLITQQIKSGGLQNFEMLFYSKSGKQIHALFSSSPMIFEGEQCHVTSIIDISDKKKAEEELKISNEKLRQLTHHLQTVREEEREAIARDIHDDFGQVLTSLKMNLAFLRRTLSNYGILNEKPDIEKEFDSMFKIIDGSVIKLRKLITNLRPEVLDKLGLIPALEWQVEEFKNSYQIESTFFSTIEDLVLDKTVQITFFRILQEALNNIAKYSKATEVKVTFTEADLCYKLEINDNGIGFEKATLAKDSFGLIGMQERVNLIKGILDIDSKPGKGTKITVCVPKHKSEVT